MAELKPCGTRAAYQRHKYHGEPIDEACQNAWESAQRSYHRARQAAFRRLARRYREAFAVLVAEEMAKEKNR